MLSSGNEIWRKKTTVGGKSHSRLLRILHIDPERNWGGGEAQVLGLLTYLAERGHQNELLAHPQGQLFERSQKLRVNTLPLLVRNDLDLRPVGSLRRRIRREKYDIVHFHTNRAHALSLWLPRGKQSPKYVVTRRMDYPTGKSRYTRYLYNQRVDGVVAISQTIAVLLAESGVDSKKIRVIYSGIDCQPFELLAPGSQAHKEEVVVGIVASLAARKGHRFLLEAAALLKGEGYRFKYLLAGEGALRRELEAIAASLGLIDEVRFYGFVTDTTRFLSEIDIFVLPSLHEGLGVAALEAMAAGKPVVATRVGGLAESVLDTVTGMLVLPGDVKALAGALANLADDPSLARAMGEKGAERVRRHFTLEQMARGNEAYYYDLLQGTN